eukprot:COSAG06_NODE_29160_length_561_cov_1.935065_1_plen_122_part_01
MRTASRCGTLPPPPPVPPPPCVRALSRLCVLCLPTTRLALTKIPSVLRSRRIILEATTRARITRERRCTGGHDTKRAEKKEERGEKRERERERATKSIQAARTCSAFPRAALRSHSADRPKP